MMRFVLIGVMILGAGAAQAQRVSKVNGTRLLAMCTVKAPTDCEAYVSGVSDTLAELKAKAACIPDAVTGRQLREVVVKYLNSNPQTRELKAGALTLKAYAAAFPCH
jgi:hypothetical protein